MLTQCTPAVELLSLRSIPVSFHVKGSLTDLSEVVLVVAAAATQCCRGLIRR